MSRIDLKFSESELNSASMIGLNIQSGDKLTKTYNYSSDGDDIFRIASMTKVLTTVAALQQVESGLIGINDPLFVARQALTGATEAAITVLRIDDVLWANVEPSTPDWSNQIDED